MVEIPTIPPPLGIDLEVLTSTFGPLEDLMPKPAAVKTQKLARSQMAAWKQRQIRLQGGVCPISQHRFTAADMKNAVIDHDHTTGRIRGVLSRSANAVEGKVKNAVARWGGTGEDYAKVIPYLKRLLAYLESEPTPYIYPFHKTADDKRLDRNKAAREARAKRAAKARIQELK